MSEFNFGDESSATKLEEAEVKQAPRTLGLSMDEFSALEERIVRAVSLVRRERQARTAAEERANELEAKLNKPNQELARIEEELKQKTEEIATLNAERDQLRQRVERILTQLDSLEL
jgi:chromosome segregation ATPase